MKENNTYRSQLIPQEEEPSSFRLIATLGVAGFFSGLLVVTVYLFTRPTIEAYKAKAMQAAIYHVLPGCASYETLELQSGALVAYSEKEEEPKAPQNPRIFAGYDKSRTLIGFAILAESPGFQEVIKGIFGYQPGQQMIIGFEVLESKETPGLGDKIIKDADFIDNFKALSVDPEIVYVKEGQKQYENEVDGITGATISSKAVVRLLQKGLETWRPAIEAYVQGNRQIGHATTE